MKRKKRSKIIRLANDFFTANKVGIPSRLQFPSREAAAVFVRKNKIKHVVSLAPITAKVKTMIGKVKNPAMLAAASRPSLFGLAKKRIKRNPPKRAVEIYGRLLRLEAQKGPGHVCDAACKNAGHCYFHDFSKHARVFGLPDGSLLIKDKLIESKKLQNPQYKKYPGMNAKEIINATILDLQDTIASLQYSDDALDIFGEPITKDVKSHTIKSLSERLDVASKSILERNPKNRPSIKKLKNPPVEIYGRLLRLEAQKGPGHVCDAACKNAGHCYFHDFSKHARVFGLPDGSLLIKDKLIG